MILYLLFFPMFHIYVTNLCLFVLGFSRINLDLWHAWKTQLYGITVPRLVRHVVDTRKQNTPGGYNHFVFASKPLDVILNSWWWWWWRRWYCLKIVAHCVVFSKAHENKPLSYSIPDNQNRIFIPWASKTPFVREVFESQKHTLPPKTKKNTKPQDVYGFFR